MPSPFPGMDPYLEQFWGDIHARLVIYACDQLQGLLPRNLRARVALAQPLILQLTDEPVTETFIEIIDIGSGRQVVTVIEVLSPANKRPGDGQDQYLKKQRELLGGKVSLVEIDLLRAGKSVLSVETRRIPVAYRTPYRFVVRRGWRLSEAEFYAVPLREPLPPIRVPLRETDADVQLDMQALLEQCYDKGGYAEDIDYEAEPDPPLPPDDAVWADAHLRKKGVRRRAPARGTKGRKQS